MYTVNQPLSFTRKNPEGSKRCLLLPISRSFAEPPSPLRASRLLSYADRQSYSARQAGGRIVISYSGALRGRSDINSAIAERALAATSRSGELRCYLRDLPVTQGVLGALYARNKKSM